MIKYIGALWKKQGNRGQYLSGEFEWNGKKVHINVYVNDRKTADKQPDFKITVNVPDPAAPVTPEVQETASEDPFLL